MPNHYQLEDYAALKDLSKAAVERAIMRGDIPICFDELGYPTLSLTLPGRARISFERELRHG